MQILEEGRSFTYVDLGLTDVDFQCIEGVKFSKIGTGSTAQYNRFGDLHLLQEELPDFLRSIGNDVEEVIDGLTKVIIRIVNNVTQSGKSAWVCVRASTPNRHFDTPRWHMDGAYFAFSEKSCMKFAATLKGPHTLLYDLPDEQRNVFIAQAKDRAFLNQLLDPNKIQSPGRGQGVFFVVGNNAIGAVHSEPKMEENRLFLSILVGEESEIQELYSRWH